MIALSLSLNGEEIVAPECAPDNIDGWWVDDNRINIRAGRHHSTYSLPRGARKVVPYRERGGRSQLAIGGLTTTSVTVTGPSKTIAKLREAVL